MNPAITAAFVQYRIKHGHEKANELLAKFGARALGNLDPLQWDAFAAELGVTAEAMAAADHAAMGGNSPKTLDEIAPAAYANWNKTKPKA
jgi:hypothetical protein